MAVWKRIAVELIDSRALLRAPPYSEMGVQARFLAGQIEKTAGGPEEVVPYGLRELAQ